jgi:hypothetical protein
MRKGDQIAPGIAGFDRREGTLTRDVQTPLRIGLSPMRCSSMV